MACTDAKKQRIPAKNSVLRPCQLWHNCARLRFVGITRIKYIVFSCARIGTQCAYYKGMNEEAKRNTEGGRAMNDCFYIVAKIISETEKAIRADCVMIGRLGGEYVKSIWFPKSQIQVADGGAIDAGGYNTLAVKAWLIRKKVDELDGSIFADRPAS